MERLDLRQVGHNMKRIEIVIPYSELKEAHEILTRDARRKKVIRVLTKLDYATGFK
ncbi:MAG: hypothetical protein WB988_11685 [Candidatus Nitrosopolaris sp.]